MLFAHVMRRFSRRTREPFATAIGGSSGLADTLLEPLAREIAHRRGNADMLNLALSASGIIGIWDGDLLGGRIYCDPNFARIYGVAAAEVAEGMPLGYFFERMHKDDVAGAYAARDRMMAGQSDFSHEHRIIRADGSMLWVAAFGRLLRDDQDRPVRFIGASVDITERRLAEARQAFLLELQDRLRGLSDPSEILTAAATHLGRYLGAARIGYGEVQPDGETLLVTNGYIDGVPPVNRSFPLSMLGPVHAARMRQGLTIVYQDAQADEHDTRTLGIELGTRAHVSVPLLRNGRFTGSLYVTHIKPYEWTADDIALIEAVAERIWDAAERGRAEVRLRESEQRLRLVLDSTGLGWWEYDAVTGGTIHSARHDEIFGYQAPLADWTYERFMSHIAAPDRARVDAGFQAALHDGADWNVECRIIRADNSSAWVKISARPQLSPQGNITRLIGSVADITERKRGEDAVIETAAKFEMFAQMVPSMVWTALPDGSIDWFNARVPEYCGIGVAEVQRYGRAVVHPDDIPIASALWRESLASGKPLTTENRIRRHDGMFRWHLTRAVPIHGADGTIIRWIGTSADIEEQKIAEQSLAELNTTLEQQVRERTADLLAAEATLRQSQKMEAVGQLTGGLAHDFNNLLTGVSGSLELLEMRLAQGRITELDRLVHSAQGAVKRAAALTHRLLAFSRRQTLDPKPTDVNRLVAGMDELIRRTMGPSIAVTFAGAPDLWPVLVDPNQLENALLNLCINARDAMPDGGSLTVDAANLLLEDPQIRTLDLDAGRYVCLRVSDTGVGMTRDVAARVFEPFFTTKPVGVGTGLGLSMVYGFARQSGGQTRVVSEPGQGTTLFLYLPACLDGEPAPEAPATAETARRGEGETVLVVDDEPTVRMLVLEVLEDLGYQVLEAESGADGLDILQSNRRVDLLLTDVGLPGGMDGRQLANAARVARPDLKILFISGYAETAIIGEGRLKPGMHIVTKPFSLETLGRRIKEILAAGHPAPPRACPPGA